MSVINDIRGTLDAMGAEQQACVFAFLISYPLTLGRLLERRGRRAAAMVASSSVLAFVVFTSPWMHAVLLVGVAIAGLGVFIVAVQLVDIAARMVALRGMAPVVAPVPVAEAAPVIAASERERVPLGSATVPLKLKT